MFPQKTIISSSLTHSLSREYSKIQSSTSQKIRIKTSARGDQSLGQLGYKRLPDFPVFCMLLLAENKTKQIQNSFFFTSVIVILNYESSSASVFLIQSIIDVTIFNLDIVTLFTLCTCGRNCTIRIILLQIRHA